MAGAEYLVGAGLTLELAEIAVLVPPANKEVQWHAAMLLPFQEYSLPLERPCLAVQRPGPQGVHGVCSSSFGFLQSRPNKYGRKLASHPEGELTDGSPGSPALVLGQGSPL